MKYDKRDLNYSPESHRQARTYANNALQLLF